MSSSQSWPNKLVSMTARPSTKSSSILNEIWCVDRGRWVMHDVCRMTRSKVMVMEVQWPISKSYLLRWYTYNEKTSGEFWSLKTMSKFYHNTFMIFFFVRHHVPFKLWVFHLWQTNFASYEKSTGNPVQVLFIEVSVFVVYGIVLQPRLAAIVQARYFYLLGHIVQMPDETDAKKILTAAPLENWRRPPGRSRS